MRSEMDSLSSDLKVNLNLLIICFVSWRKYEEEHCMEEKNYECGTYFTHRQISAKTHKNSNPFFYLCIRNGKSIFNYMGKVDQGLTY